MPFSSPISQLLGDTLSDIREFLLSACYSAIVSCQYASPTNAIAASIFFLENAAWSLHFFSMVGLKGVTVMSFTELQKKEHSFTFWSH